MRLRLSGKAENTRRAYERDLEEFIDYVDKPIQAITLSDAQRFQRHLEAERELATATVWPSATRTPPTAPLATRAFGAL